MGRDSSNKKWLGPQLTPVEPVSGDGGGGESRGKVGGKRAFFFFASWLRAGIRAKVPSPAWSNPSRESGEGGKGGKGGKNTCFLFFDRVEEPAKVE
jgi:hypothetical protein